MTMRPNRVPLPTVRPGFTLVELLLGMVVSLILTGAVVAIFGTFGRGTEQQNLVRDVQTEVHVSVEQLVKLIRNADEVDATSEDDRLVVRGGLTWQMCGDQRCEVVQEGRTLLIRSGTAGGREWVLARALAEDSGIEIAYWQDANGNGRLDGPDGGFVPSGQVTSFDDVRGVRVKLSFDAREGRGKFSGDVSFHAVLRTKVLERFTL